MKKAGECVADVFETLRKALRNGITTLETTEVAKGDTFTFPDHIAQVDHIKDFVGINGTTGTYVPTDTITVDGNKEYKIERAFTVTIRNTDGTTKDVFTVDQGDDLTLPDATTAGYEDVKEFTDGENTYPLGSEIENIQEDIILDVVPYTYYNVYIDGVQQQETVREGEGYTTPTDMPGVTKFGEDSEVDKLIRKYGYIGRLNILKLLNENDDLKENSGVAAHLIHGSSDSRFKIYYAVKKITKEEIRSVNFIPLDYDEIVNRYDPSKLKEGWNNVYGEEIFFISNPALGLWMAKNK